MIEIFFFLSSSFLSVSFFFILFRIACTDEFSGIIGTKGMSEIMGTYDVHVEMNIEGTPEYIAALFTLVSQLAFHQDNLKYVMQCNGVKHAIDAAEKYSDDSEVILHALQVVDNCGTASSDLAHMVENAGGTQLLETIIQENRFEDCVDAAKSAKLGIQAMIRATQTTTSGSRTREHCPRSLFQWRGRREAAPPETTSQFRDWCRSVLWLSLPIHFCCSDVLFQSLKPCGWLS